MEVVLLKSGRVCFSHEELLLLYAKGFRENIMDVKKYNLERELMVYHDYKHKKRAWPYHYIFSHDEKYLIYPSIKGCQRFNPFILSIIKEKQPIWAKIIHVPDDTDINKAEFHYLKSDFECCIIQGNSWK